MVVTQLTGTTVTVCHQRHHWHYHQCHHCSVTTDHCRLTSLRQPPLNSESLFTLILLCKRLQPTPPRQITCSDDGPTVNTHIDRIFSSLTLKFESERTSSTAWIDRLLVMITPKKQPIPRFHGAWSTGYWTCEDSNHCLLEEHDHRRGTVSSCRFRISSALENACGGTGKLVTCCRMKMKWIRIVRHLRPVQFVPKKLGSKLSTEFIILFYSFFSVIVHYLRKTISSISDKSWGVLSNRCCSCFGDIFWRWLKVFLATVSRAIRYTCINNVEGAFSGAYD